MKNEKRKVKNVYSTFWKVGRNNQRALRRMLFTTWLHPVQCATLIAPYGTKTMKNEK
jgi:hypothetical protein